MPQPPLENFQIRETMCDTLCQVLKYGDEASDCESSFPCYYSHIEGLGLHVAYIIYALCYNNKETFT